MQDNDLPLGMRRLLRNYGAYTGIMVGVMAVWSWAGWGFPFVMAKDYVPRMAQLESTIDLVLSAQLEQSQITLQGRIQDLDRELSKAQEGDRLYMILASQRLEASNQLTRVRRQIEDRRPR